MAWLTAQGHRPRVEKVVGRDGRTDLHVVVEDAGSALEVQLSPLSDTLWRQRDDRYRARAQHVTWLYGPSAEGAAATEVAVRGVSFALRRHGAALAVGVRDVDDHVRWVRLAACRLSADGFSAPGLEAAHARHAERVAERLEAVRRMARRGARTAPGRTHGGQAARGEGEVGRPAAGAPRAALTRPLPFPG